MYNEIEIIETVDCRETQIDLLLLFIEEYGGWLQHLKSIGLSWGVNGEEVGANKEAVKTRQHLDRLKGKVLELSNIQK